MGNWLTASGISGFLAVALGAFGAHGLQARLADAADGAKRLSWWQTAAHYHLMHALALAVVAFVLLTRLRRPKAPQTSFYQPVRIKAATVAVSHVEGAASGVTFMKVAFTNPDYLNLFRNANREAIEAGSVAVVKT